MTDIIFTTIGQIFFLAMPFWLIGLGLLLSQRAGILQWGVEGTVLLVSGLMLPLAGQGLGVALSVAALVGIAMAIFYFFISNLLKGSNLMAGIIVLLIGFALQKILTPLSAINGPAPLAGTMLTGGFYYVAPYGIIILLLLVDYFLHHTRWGMIWRGMGSDPMVIKTLYPLRLLQLLATMVGGLLIGLGAGLLVMALHQGNALLLTGQQSIASFYTFGDGGFGWLSLLLVAVAGWSPRRLLLFSFCLAAIIAIPLPYIVIYTAILMVLIIYLRRHSLYRNAPHCWRAFFLENIP